MKPFNLEEYLKNPSRKIVTKLGRNARIICTNRVDSIFPIVALIESKWGESTTVHTKDGKYFLNDASDCDLFFAPEKHEGWINVCRSLRDGEPYCSAPIYQCEEVAKKMGGVATIKIEWEE